VAQFASAIQGSKQYANRSQPRMQRWGVSSHGAGAAMGEGEAMGDGDDMDGVTQCAYLPHSVAQ
jgi:hypothetical protein